MPTVVSRVFRDMSAAQEALKGLRSAGFGAQDIAVMAHQEETVKSLLGDKGKVGLSKNRDVAAGGWLENMLARVSGEVGDVVSTLTDALGVAPEMANYCEFSVGAGGVVVATQTDEAKAPEAKKILKEAAIATKELEISSPGFYVADRMSATNPIDAQMTGDFRRY